MFRLFTASTAAPVIYSEERSDKATTNTSYVGHTVPNQTLQSFSGTVDPTPGPAPVAALPFFKDIFDIAVTIQVNNDPDSDFYGNVEVLTMSGWGYVFVGDRIAPVSRAIAHGTGIESGEGWVMIQALDVEAACADIAELLWVNPN